VLHEITPSDLTWTVRGNTPPALNVQPRRPIKAIQRRPPRKFSWQLQRIGPKFVERAQAAILHRDPARFGSLLSLVCRPASHHYLLNAADRP